MASGETHSKQRERGRSHLYGEVFAESKTLHPPGTAHCHSALSRATFGKDAQAGCGLSGFFNPCTDVTLASIHIPPSMWGSNCEGPPPADCLGADSHWPGSWVSAELETLNSGDSLTSPAAILQTGLGQGWGVGHLCALKCEWFSVKMESKLKNIWEKLPFISPS